MHLFVEANFIIDFEIMYDESKQTIGQEKLFQIFKEYTDLKIYFDKSEPLLEDESRLFSLVTDNNPSFVELGNLDTYFSNIVELPNQTIVFTRNVSEYRDKVEQLGALCFSFEDFEHRISSLISTLHCEYELSEGEFNNWSLLEKFSLLPFKTVVIDDPYILVDKPNQLIKDNILPMLQHFLHDKEERIFLTVFTKEVKNNKEEREKISEMESVEKRHRFLVSRLSKRIKGIFIIESNLVREEYIQHDRYLYTPFSVVSVGSGFNLFPQRKSNSSVRCSTFFDKGTYKKIKSHFKFLQSISVKIQKTDLKSYTFRMYPESKKVELFID